MIKIVHEVVAPAAGVSMSQMFHEVLEPAHVETGILAATLGFFAYSALALLIGA